MIAQSGPRVLFAAERTLFAWNRTGISLLGAFIEAYSVFQHRHFLATLHEMDIPAGYNTKAAMTINDVVGFMGVMPCLSLVFGML